MAKIGQGQPDGIIATIIPSTLTISAPATVVAQSYRRVTPLIIFTSFVNVTADSKFLTILGDGVRPDTIPVSLNIILQQVNLVNLEGIVWTGRVYVAPLRILPGASYDNFAIGPYMPVRM